MTWADVLAAINNLLTIEYNGANDIQRLRQAFALIINQINAGDADPENESLWDPEEVYPQDTQPVFWQDKWLASNIADNEGIMPIDSGGVVASEWRIVGSSSGSGIIVHAPQVYPNTLEIVFSEGVLYYLDRDQVGAAPYNSLNFATELANGVWKILTGSSSEGVLSSGDVLLDLIAGRIYGELSPLTGDIVLDMDGSKIGAVSILNHNDDSIPEIIGFFGNIIVHGTYVVDVFNQIFISKTGASTITVVYTQPELEEGDLTAPTFSSGPTAQSIEDESFEVAATLNENGTVYGYLLADGSLAPDTDTVIANAQDSFVDAGSGGVLAFTGLADNTAFDVYIVAVDTAGNKQAAPVFIEVTTDETDVTAPTFSSGPTAQNIDDESFEVAATLNENGTVYGYLLADGSLAPDTDTVIANAQDSFVDAGSGGVLAFTGLAASTDYDVYIVAADTLGNKQAAPVLVEVSTTAGDVLAPTFSSGPTAQNIDDESFEVAATLNENGTVYGYLLANGSPAPDTDTVIANAQDSFVDAGSGGVLAFTGLAASTDYDVYIVAADTLGNKQAAPVLVEVSTTSGDIVAPTFSAGPTAENITGTTFDISATLNENGTVYGYLIANGSPAPDTDTVIANAQDSFVDAGSGGNLAFTGLTDQTDYDIYVVGVDTVGNKQAAPTLVEVFTNSYSAEAVSVFDNMPNSLTTPEKDAIAAFVDNISYVSGIHEVQSYNLLDESNALQGWKDKSVAVNHGAAYTAGEGYKSDTDGEYLNSNIIPSTVGLTLNNAAYHIYLREKATLADLLDLFGITQTDGTTRLIRIIQRTGATRVQYSCHNGGNSTLSSKELENDRVYSLCREGMSSIKLYEDGVEIGSASVASVSLPSIPIYMLCLNNDSTAQNWYKGAVGGICVSDVSEIANVSTRFKTLMNALLP